MANLRKQLITWLLRKLDPAEGDGLASMRANAKLEDLLAKMRARDRALRERSKQRLAQHRKRKKLVHALEKKLLALSATNQTLQDKVRDEKNRLTAALSRPGLAWELPTQTQRTRSWLAIKLRHWAWQHSMRLGVLFQYEGKPLVWDKLPAPQSNPKDWPTLAVVTPSFNQAEFLERTLQSVLDQNYPKLEYVVMDGGSQDGSREIIERYADRLHHWQSAPDGGHTAALADGFARTSGEIMAWLNSDDIWAPGTLAFVADYFTRHPNVQALYGHRVLIDAADRDVGRWILPRHDMEFTKWADFIPQETLFWRRACFEKAGGMDATFRFAMDWDLILRLQKADPNMVRLPYVLGGFRVHAAQKSQTQIHSVAVEENQLLRQRELGTSFTELRLEQRVILFQVKAVLINFLLRWGIRW